MYHVLPELICLELCDSVFNSCIVICNSAMILLPSLKILFFHLMQKKVLNCHQRFQWTNNLLDATFESII